MKPVLLLIPGMLNDGRVWADVAALLAGDADVRMAEVSRQDSIARMRGDAWAQLADVPDSAPVVVAGFSMGGYVALDMLAHPARSIQGLLFMSTSAMPETEQSRVVREKTLAAMGADFPRFVSGVQAFNTYSTDPVLGAQLRRMMLDIGPETGRRQVQAIMGRQDHRALLENLPMPVRVLVGRHDRVTPPPLSEALAQQIAQAQLEIIDDAGHMLPREKPEAVARVLRELISGTTTTDTGDNS
ncbi:MAG: alpha/beta hydrolase [Ramlibacter sp.]|uniref:alpha/beta fold hydrolase n=1 Tax=Ramlibacter sp. TaxID=1917967 RepID=UPI00262C4038|nr:alpha/beta hydrolase [Ramlibacter sp.]MDH4377326.1 alpha/beta hydrolase [Ramlibacter sp.]